MPDLKKCVFQNIKRYMSVHPQPCKEPLTVALVGAGSPTGRIASMLLKQNKLIRHLKLHCYSEDVCGMAIDVSHIDSSTKVKAYIGRETLKDALSGAHVIVVCGRGQLKANETEEEIFQRSAPHVRTIAIHASEYAPDAIFCVGLQPVNSLVPMVSEEYKKARVYDHKKIIGITNLATIRTNALIGCYTNYDACKITCPVIGGVCPYSSVCVLSQAKPCEINQEMAKKIQERLRKAENAILTLKSQEGNNDSCYLSNALAISRFVTHLTKAMEGCNVPVQYAFVRQKGHIEPFLPYMASVVTLGPEGITSTHMPKLNKYECEELQKAAVVIGRSIELGTSYITGEKPKKPKRIPKLSTSCPQVKINDSTHEFQTVKEIFPGKKCPTDQAEENLLKQKENSKS